MGLNRRTCYWLVLLALISVTVLACSAPSWLAASSAASSGDVLFQDDFSNPNSGWDVWSEGGSSVLYEEGGLRFRVNQSHFDFWSRPGKHYDNVCLAVNTTKLGGPDNNDFGLMCRYQDKENYYAFLVGSDGYQGIVKVQEGVYSILSGENLQYSEVIRQGSATNKIQAECIGTSLLLIVNGEPVAAVQDAQFGSGEIGLIAGTFETPGVDILFDDFVATEP